MARRRCAFEVGSVYASSCLRARAPTCGGTLSDGPSMQIATPAGSTYCCASRSQSSGEAQARATAACTRGSSSREGFPSSRTATALTLGNRNSARTDFRKATFFCTESTRTTSRSGRAMATGIPGKPAPVPASRRLPEGSTGTTASESRTCFSATSSGSVMAVRFTDLFHFSIKSTCRPSCLSWSGPSRTPICAAPSPIVASRAASTLTSPPGQLAEVQHQPPLFSPALAHDLHPDERGAALLLGDAGVEQLLKVGEGHLLLAHGPRAGGARDEQDSLDLAHVPRLVAPTAVAADGLLHFLAVLGEVRLDLRVGNAQVAEDPFVQGAGGRHAVALAQDGLHHGCPEQRILP